MGVGLGGRKLNDLLTGFVEANLASKAMGGGLAGGHDEREGPTDNRQ